MTLIVHSFLIVDENSPKFLQTLKARAISDNRIVIFEGSLVGDFTNIVKYLIPLNSYIPPKDTIIDTLKELVK